MSHIVEMEAEDYYKLSIQYCTIPPESKKQ